MGIIALILLAVAVIAFVASAFGGEETKPKAILVGVLGLIAALVLGFFASTYTQQVGQAKVIKDWAGKYVTTDVTDGLSFIAPWQETVDFDILNQQSIYKGNGQPSSKEEVVNGPEITVQDKDKVTANVDVAIRYSLDAGSIEDIYNSYLSQEALTARLIDQDMRSEVRNSFSKYTTAQVLENREEIEKVVADKLSKRWADDGVIVNSVSLQGIRYPEATSNGFTDAQQSVTNLKKAEADLKVKEAETQQKVIEAEANADAAIAKAKGEAEANRLVSKSITPELLKKQELEAFAEFGKNGNSIVMGGSGDGIFDMRGKATEAKK